MDLSKLAADRFGIQLTPQQIEQFAVYTRELADWNERVNLTAITEPDAVLVRHYLDSLSIVTVAPPRSGLRAVDVGTGAGFPGLPLSMVYPDIHVTLMEATGKKVAFLEHLIALFGLSNATALHARAEEAGHLPDHRAGYDLVLARAVARLPALLEYLLPLAKVGGHCVAMKGETAQEEADGSRRALSMLGGRLVRIEAVTLPDVPETHYLVVVEKIAPTPPTYPRRPGIPTRKPIE